MSIYVASITSRDAKKDKRSQPPRNSFDYWTWFKNAVTATKVMNKLVRGENFPRKFTRMACREAFKQVISEESPHPYDILDIYVNVVDIHPECESRPQSTSPEPKL